MFCINCRTLYPGLSETRQLPLWRGFAACRVRFLRGELCPSLRCAEAAGKPRLVVTGYEQTSDLLRACFRPVASTLLTCWKQALNIRQLQRPFAGVFPGAGRLFRPVRASGESLLVKNTVKHGGNFAITFIFAACYQRKETL